MMTKAKKTIVTGVLLLNKPAGITSQSALTKVKRLLMADDIDSKKAGHTGTLDPMATGLLPICFGEATKFSSYGLNADKGYKALIELGKKTDTGDKDGTVISQQAVPLFEQADLDEIAVAMTGEQLQIAPKYSALKKDGKKLYEYAREGIQIDCPSRLITLHQISLTKVSNHELLLTLICSKGTYVRVLGEQIAERLGTVGHLTALHRTSTGGFEVAQAIGIDELDRLTLDERLGCLLPIDVMMGHLPIMPISFEEHTRVCLGQRLNVQDRMDLFATVFANRDEKSALVRLYVHDTFVGLAEVWPTGRLQPRKGVNNPLQQSNHIRQS